MENLTSKEDSSENNYTTQSNGTYINYAKFFIFVAIAVILGTILGFGITKISAKNGKTDSSKTSAKANKNIPKSMGVKDIKTFPDKTEGLLKEGGIEGEGNFHLERPGGKSQNVYLTSTTIDLELFIGNKIRVWGQTFKGQKAGWLMDVGYVELL